MGLTEISFSERYLSIINHVFLQNRKLPPVDIISRRLILVNMFFFSFLFIASTLKFFPIYISIHIYIYVQQYIDLDSKFTRPFLVNIYHLSPFLTRCSKLIVSCRVTKLSKYLYRLFIVLKMHSVYCKIMVS